MNTVASECTIGVAISVPAPYGDELRSFRGALGDPQAAVVPSHITLLPPTEISQDLVPGIRDHLSLAAAANAPFSISLRGAATFRPISPVVFVQLSRGISACELLEQSVRSGPLLREVKFPYHPHVTVAHELSDELLDRAERELAGYEAQFQVTEFKLYQHAGDEKWQVVGNFPLGG